jgi:antirestriction protein ArdC
MNTAAISQKDYQNGDKLNVYQIVTDRIIASLEKGVIPWEKPWKSPKYSGGNLSPKLSYRQAIPRHQRVAVMGNGILFSILAHF